MLKRLSRIPRQGDPEVENWLREEVVPSLLEYEADPSRGIPAEEVFERIQQRLRDRLNRPD
jgi:hypothetical protein